MLYWVAIYHSVKYTGRLTLMRTRIFVHNFANKDDILTKIAEDLLCVVGWGVELPRSSSSFRNVLSFHTKQ